MINRLSALLISLVVIAIVSLLVITGSQRLGWWSTTTAQVQPHSAASRYNASVVQDGILTFSPESGELGVMIKANTEARVSCGLTGITFPLMGPLLQKDDTIRLTIVQYAGEQPGGSDDLIYRSPALHSIDPSFSNTLVQFERGRKYAIKSDRDVTFQCGRNLETIYQCGNGVIEGTQAQAGVLHQAEECDGSQGCSPTCLRKTASSQR